MDGPVAAPPMQRQLVRRRARTLPALLVAAALAPFAPSLLFSMARAPFAGRSGRLHPRQLRAAGARAALGLAADTKAKLFDLLEDGSLAKELLQPEGRAVRGRLDEAILELERQNPTDEPAYSELLDGTWKVKYAGAYAPGLVVGSPTRELALFLYSGGFSPSNALASLSAGFWGQALGLQLGQRRVRIVEGRDVHASAEVEVAGQKETLKYTAELMPLSPSRMSEEVVGFELPGPLGKQDSFLEMRRTMLVTYLDEELLVVRDENGVPEVLVKELVEVSPSEPAAPAGEAEANATADENATGAAEASSPAATNSTTP